MTKVYAIYGRVECSKVFQLGRVTLRCLFSGGSISGSGCVPARFTTSDGVIQAVIEASADYKNGAVKLDSEFGDDAHVDSDSAMNLLDFPDVINTQGAKDVLMADPYNVPLKDLGSKAVILNKATQLGITFSNWK